MRKKIENKEIGIVASGSNPMHLKFYAREQITDDYVMIKDGYGKIVYEITDVEAYNTRLEDIEFVRNILPGENYGKYNIYRANAILMGKIKKHTIVPVGRWYVTPPGEVVRYVDDDDIALIYGVESGGLKQRIGTMVRHQQIQVYLDFPALLTTHMAVVGRSGHGKSNMIKVLLKNFPMQFVVFTKVNEYSKFDNIYVENLDNATLNWNVSAIKKVFELNNTEMQNLNNCVKHYDFSNKMNTWELSKFIQEYYSESRKYKQVSLFGLEQGGDEALPKYVESLCKKLESYSVEINFSKKPEYVKDSHIINMQELDDKEEEIQIFSYLSNLLSYKTKRFSDIGDNLQIEDRIVIFIEEAHNYIPSSKTSICKDIIRKIAREGRKLGIHLVLLSQRPRHLDPTALSQCGSIISFNLTNPEDIDYLMSNANFYGDSYKKTIRELQIGECMIVSDFLNKGLTCKVDLDV